MELGGGVRFASRMPTLATIKPSRRWGTRFCVLFCCGGDGGGWENFVHAAGAVALGVEGDVKEAEGAHGGSDLVEGFEIEGAGEFGAGDFYAGQVSVVADADLMEAEGVEGFFGLLDLSEIFAGYGAAVFDAGGEAGAGGLVPELQAGLLGQGADF